ncbi:tRNA-splicing endonuclease subunit Sen15 [Xylariaceae sp. FL0255]|nr:tRNA-splicing endonuclease subunit Sen15 [Xylariaceae sp. FL0255]
MPEGADDAWHLANTVLDNLQYQHLWTELRILTRSLCAAPAAKISESQPEAEADSDSDPDSQALPRPMVYGLPPKRLYVHPDDQVAMVKSGVAPDDKRLVAPEPEWVLPTHLAEKWSVEAFARVFDALPASGRDDRPKRLVLATVTTDSTITYYVMHDGIVKPRQN